MPPEVRSPAAGCRTESATGGAGGRRPWLADAAGRRRRSLPTTETDVSALTIRGRQRRPVKKELNRWSSRLARSWRWVSVSWVWAAWSARAARAAAGRRASARPRTQAAPRPPPPRRPRAVFGTVDIEAVLKDYDKVKAQQEEFKAARDGQAQRADEVPDRGAGRRPRGSRSDPGSVDAKKIEDQITQLRPSSRPAASRPSASSPSARPR